MRIRWIDISCFELETDEGKRVVTDPYIDACPNHPIGADEVKAMDYILITHTHVDHLTDLNLFFEKYRPRILASPLAGMRLVELMDLSGQCVYGMDHGECLDFGDLAFTRISGHHTIPNRRERHLTRESVVADAFECMYPAGKAGIYRKLMCSGYHDFSSFYIRTPDNTGILFWGGTVGHEDVEKARMFHPDLILMQIPSNPMEEIAEFVKATGASYVIPHHHDTYFGVRDVEQMMRDLEETVCRVNPQVRVLPLEQGKWYEFRKTLRPAG